MYYRHRRSHGTEVLGWYIREWEQYKVTGRGNGTMETSLFSQKLISKLHIQEARAAY